MKIYKTSYTDGTIQFSFVENVGDTYLFVMLWRDTRSRITRDRSGCTWGQFESFNWSQKKTTPSNGLEVLIVLGHTAEYELEKINENQVRSEKQDRGIFCGT